MTCTQICDRPPLSEEPGSNERCVSILIKGLVNLFDMFSRLMFCLLFVVTGYLFIFFKMQERVHTFLPGVDVFKEEYKSYDWLFSFVVGTKLFYMIFKIYFEQC